MIGLVLFKIKDYIYYVYIIFIYIIKQETPVSYSYFGTLHAMQAKCYLFYLFSGWITVTSFSKNIFSQLPPVQMRNPVVWKFLRKGQKLRREKTVTIFDAFKKNNFNGASNIFGGSGYQKVLIWNLTEHVFCEYRPCVVFFLSNYEQKLLEIPSASLKTY